MLSSDDENPPPQSDPNSVAVVVSPPPRPPPGDESDLHRPPERDEGAPAAAASAVLPASDPPPPPPPHNSNNNFFSIREYVFRSRSKDIFANWPFSQKNLQLCLQHGVTEVLPPFQHLDTARCRSFEIPKLENRSVVAKDCVANFKSEPSGSKLKKVSSLQGSDHAAELDVCGAAPSEQLSTVQFSARDDVQVVAPWVSRVSTEQVTKEARPPPTSLKSGSLAQSAGKKCRFIVKFGNKYERSFGDDAASNCAGVSENMGSKVCPVCKIFSSSSNTTLNAHIDQCLSLDSPPQRLSMRHRIKPRKTRLMVEIYETARRCTIEELNQRNGLNWANPSSLPSPNSHVASDKERRPSTPMVHAGNADDAGAVYIDSNGTKLRILSKFNDDQPEQGSAKDMQLKKSLQGKKGNGICKKKMEKLHRQKHYKKLKLASKGKNPQKANDSQKKPRGTQGREGYPGSSQSSLGLLEHSLSGTLKQWSSSKRTGPKKKLAAKEGENPQMPIRSCSPNLLNSSEDSDYSQSSKSEKEPSWPVFRRACELEPHMICETSLAWSDVTPDSVVNWGYPPVKRKLLPEEDHLREVDVSDVKKNIGRGRSDVQRKGIDTGSMRGRQLRPRPSSTEALRFSKLRKRVLRPLESYENSSDVSAGRADFCLKSQQLPLVGASRQMSEDPVRDRSVEEGPEFELSSGESSERETASLREGAETSDPRGEVQYSKSTSNDVGNTEPSADELEDCTWGLSKYYEPSHLDLGDYSKTQTGSRQFLGISEDSFCGVGNDFSRAYEACEDVDMENANGKNDEVDAAGQSTSFLEIDPIPIPGPPGSFLPSPGAVGSDDFQGNSSLTSSQTQSSHDQEDLVDGDASDSLISATSTISNSAEAKARMDYSAELVSGGRPLLPEDISSIGIDVFPIRRDPSASVPTSCSTSGDPGIRANNVSVKKGPPLTGNVNEPCCCQKKERAVFQGIVLDNRELEPPGPRRSPSVAVPRMAWPANQISSGGYRSDERYDGAIPKPAKPLEILSSMSFGEFPSSSGRADCDFQSASGSNPVLRLMGKDLIVVNKEDNPGIPDRSQSQSSAPPSSKSSESGIPHESIQNQDYPYNDLDYPHARSIFTGSSSGYPGITVPVAVQATKQVPVSSFTSPEVPGHFTVTMGTKYGGGLNSSGQFDSGKAKPVGASKHTVPKAAPLIKPGRASGKESEFPSFAISSTSAPLDAFIPPRTLPNTPGGTSALPAVYQTREPTILHDPVVELARSHPKGTIFINRKPGGNNADVQRAPPFIMSPPNLLGYHGSGYVFYRSYS